MKGTPEEKIIATRFKRIARKAGKEALGGFKNILVDIVSETVKKILWPQNI